MKSFHKLVVWIICFLVLSTSISGCKNTSESGGTEQSIKKINETGYPIFNEKTSFEVMAYRDSSHGEYEKMMLWEEMESKTNIHIEWQLVESRVGREKRNIMLASGTYPDAFFNCNFNPSEISDYGDQGVFVPLNDMIDKYGVNLKDLITKNSDIKAGITTTDGKIYSYPMISLDKGLNVEAKQINKSWLDALDLQMPKTLVDYYNVLKAFKTRDPNKNGINDEIPISGWNGGGGEGAGRDSSGVGKEVKYLLGSYGLSNTVGGFNLFTTVGNDGKVKLVEIDAKYREVLEFLNKLFNEKLIDDEIVTQNKTQVIAKGSSGQIGSITHVQPSSFFQNRTNDFIPMPALEGPYGDHVYSSVSPKMRLAGKFVVTNKCKNPEALVRWIDYFYSEEGAKLIRLGKEGLTYRKLSDGTNEYTEVITKNPNGLTRDNALGQYTIFVGTGAPCVQMYPAIESTSLKNFKANEAAVGNDWPKEVFPTLFTSKQNRAELTALESDIATYMDEMKSKFILGQVPLTDASWNNYIERIKKMGSDKIALIYQETYDTIKAKK